MGREVRYLDVDPPEEFGSQYVHTIPWDGKDKDNKPVAAGRFFVHAVIDNNFNLQLLKSLKFAIY